MEFRMLFLIIIFFIFSSFIKTYNKKLISMHKDNYACFDIMNQKIISILGFDMCFWNFMHIIIYFIACILFNARLNFKIHFFVFCIGLSWLLLSPFKEDNNEHNKCINTVYEDTFKPRTDDLFFNTLGQVIYIFAVKFDLVNFLKNSLCDKL